ncbi:Elongation factor P-like protein [Labeo rohita]|uniref:Elongation factor P-like protein n=1 Tax=Labeo rohita TaxID=84645 RepID=A0ABQ8L3N1_LABRO|nr:Elongation factor P-like protein [Labeo rohita]
MGHKLHMDQNEKLVMFAVIHTCSNTLWNVGSDSCGSWQRVLPLSAHAREANHTVQRMWPGINNWVNYPLKEALVQLQDQEAIGLEDSLTRFCTSSLTGQVCQIGMNRFMECSLDPKDRDTKSAGWDRNTKKNHNATVAADMYECDMGSSLTRISSFGSDHFLCEVDKVRTEQHFSHNYPDLAFIFDSVANYNYVLLKEALDYLIDVTEIFLISYALVHVEPCHKLRESLVMMKCKLCSKYTYFKYGLQHYAVITLYAITRKKCKY